MKKKDKKSQARKVSSLPSRVFAFGALRPTDPEQQKLISSQLEEAYHYRRELVGIECRCRDGFRAIRAKLSKTLESLECQYEACEEEYKQETEQLRKIKDPADPKHCLSRAERGATPEGKVILARVNEIKARKKDLEAQIKAERKRVADTFFEPGNLVVEGFKTKFLLLKGKKQLGPRSKEQQELNELLEDFVPPLEAWGELSPAQARKAQKAWCKKSALRVTAHREVLEAREATGCFPGVYQAVEAAARQSFRDAIGNPRVPKLDGRGKVGIQTAKRSETEDSERDLTVADAFSGRDPRLKIEIVDGPLRGNKAASRLVRSMPDATPAEIVAAAQKLGFGKRFTTRVVEDIRRSKPTKNPEPFRRLALARIKLKGHINDAVFIDVPFVLHRPMPQDAIIKWVYLVVGRIGSRFTYEIQFTLEHPSFGKRLGVRHGTLAVAIGWRALTAVCDDTRTWDDKEVKPGDIVVASTWDGTTDRVVVIPAKLREARDASEKWISYSDKHFDTARQTLKAWAKKAKLEQTLAPRLMAHPRWNGSTEGDARRRSRALLENMSMWRNHRKLWTAAYAFRDIFLADLKLDVQADEKADTPAVKRLWKRWRQQRLSNGDDLFTDFDALATWLKTQGVTNQAHQMAVYLDWWLRKDKHLTDMARGLDKRTLRSRREIFRRFSAWGAAIYETAVVEEWNKSKSARKPAVEDDTRTRHDEGTNALRQFCGVSFLTSALQNAFGKDYSKRNITARSKVHYGCGGKAVGTPDISQLVECKRCHLLYDHGKNKARHLWHEQCGGDETPGSARTPEVTAENPIAAE